MIRIFFESGDFLFFFKFAVFLFLLLINVKTFYSVFDIACFVFAKIIYNTLTKLLNEDVFYGEELVRLALTSLMPRTKPEIENQFYLLSEMMEDIKFVDDDVRTSFTGIVLLLSNLYFGENDDIKKVLQMYINKVDCLTEAMEEVEESKCIKIGIKMVEIPIGRLNEEYRKYLREKLVVSV